MLIPCACPTCGAPQLVKADYHPERNDRAALRKQIESRAAAHRIFCGDKYREATA